MQEYRIGTSGIFSVSPAMRSAIKHPCTGRGSVADRETLYNMRDGKHLQSKEAAGHRQGKDCRRFFSEWQPDGRRKPERKQNGSSNYKQWKAADAHQ